MVDKDYAKEFHPAKFIAEGSGVWTWLWYLIVSGLLTMFIFGIIGQLAYGFGLWFIFVLYITASLIYTNHSVRKGATVRSSVKNVNKQVYYGNKTPVDRIIERKDIPNKPVDLKNYILQKANGNVMIVGTTGQGKSKLTRYLLEQFADNRKIIFSFKPNDEYLKMGYTIVEASKALPNALRDIEAFVNAFVITFPMTAIGITAQYIPVYLREIGKDSRNWKEFNENIEKKIKNTKNPTQQSALLYLKEHVKSLYNDSAHEVPELNENVVFDFSSLNEDAKTFYAELILRQIWKDILTPGKKERVIVCVDEAHRLLRTFEKYESIYVEMSREIRAFGMLWTATQNYTDIPSHVRNQFGTQFIFNTNHDDDLKALRAIDEKLAWAAVSLPKHYFTDARYEWLHQAVPEISLFWEAQDKERVYYEAQTKAEPLMPAQPQDRPSPTVHGALLAMQYSQDASLAGLAAWLKASGFAISDNTIYGYGSREGVFDAAASLGLAQKQKKGFVLTASGKRWVDPATILKDELNAGSDLHKQILAKTIAQLHKGNMLVVAPREREAHDLVAYPVDRRKKYLWDDKARMAYEIQTSARKDAIELNGAKKEKYGLPITWVTYDKDIMKDIKEITAGADSYMLVGLGEDNGK